MARPWRLRHKLVLGLALVVASVALLLGAAVFGLSSYFEAGRVTRTKFDELQIVQQLRERMAGLAAAPTASQLDSYETRLNSELRATRAEITALRTTLKGYEETLAAGRSGGPPIHDYAQIPKMREGLDVLEKAVAAAVTPASQGGRVADDAGVKEATARLNLLINDHAKLLMADIQRTHERAEANHRRSLVFAGGGSAVAVILVGTLLYYFQVWVFGPVRAIQAGVRRVHAGDFSRPIQTPSDDELGELAAEFNRMAARMMDVQVGLAAQVTDRTRQLVRSERMVSVGFLAAGVAHEINNPLASIAFCAEALERRLQDGGGRAPGDAEVVQKYLKMMQDEAQRCKLITQKLLDFSRSGGKREPADLAVVVGDVVEVARVLPNARNKRVVFQPHGPVVTSVSVPDLKGVVLNLVVNALDSMDDGGHLTVELAARDEVAEIRFADTGCGMAADTLAHIFEPFFTRNRTGHGTGLGLSISHQVIDQHGGTISAASPGPGRGSTFTIRLPLGIAEADDRPATVPFPARTAA